MTSPQDILFQIDMNEYTLQRQLRDLTHEDSLLQLPFRGNSLNWVMGHIVEARNYTMEMLGLTPVWTAAQIERYTTRSAPVTPDSVHEQFEEIRAAGDQALAQIRAKLESMTNQDLEVIPAGDTQTLGQILLRMNWHEAYHTGQTEILRQLAGKNDAVL